MDPDGPTKGVLSTITKTSHPHEHPPAWARVPACLEALPLYYVVEVLDEPAARFPDPRDAVTARDVATYVVDGGRSADADKPDG